MAHIAAAVDSTRQQSADVAIWHCSGRVVTGRALHAVVARASAALSARLGCRAGDRVGLLGLNTPEYQAALLAAADAGAVICPFNWRWSPAELAAALALVAPSLVFADPPCLGLLQAAAARPECPPFAIVPLTPIGDGPEPPAAAAGAPVSAAPAAGPAAAAAAGGGGAAGAVPPRRPACSLDDLIASCGPLTGGPAPQLQLLRPADGAALVCFTSGTTSAPKGAVITHAALMHQSMAKLAVVGYCRADTYLHMAPLCHIGGLSSALAALLAGAQQVFMPRYSAAEAVRLVQAHRVTALIAVPTMMEDAVAVLAGDGGTTGSGGGGGGSMAVAQQRAVAPGGPLGSGDGSGASLPSVLRVLVGGGGMRPRLVPLVRGLFPNATISSAYGMTEAASSITFLCPAAPPPARARGDCGDCGGCGQQSPAGAPGSCAATCGSDISACSSGSGAWAREGGASGGDAPAGPGGVCVGAPAPGIQVAIMEAQDAPSGSGRGPSGRGPSGSVGSGAGRAGEGVVGEVLTRGPHVMAGYWRDPQQTRQAFLPGGWLRTGDLGWLDAAGRLWLLGRAKDTVKSGGENVHAAEVEAALDAHPAVAAAAVVGIPDARLGEVVAAAVVLRPGWAWAGEGGGGGGGGGAVGARELQEHCRALGLTPYKLPRRLAALQELPRNSSGKVVKPALKQLLLGAQPRSAL